VIFELLEEVILELREASSGQSVSCANIYSELVDDNVELRFTVWTDHKVTLFDFILPRINRQPPANVLNLSTGSWPENPAALTNPFLSWRPQPVLPGNTTFSRNLLSSEQREQGPVATARPASWKVDQTPSLRQKPKD